MEPRTERARFRIEPAHPFSFARTSLRFARFPDAVDLLEEGCYRRLLFVEGAPLLVSARPARAGSRDVLAIELEGAGARRAAARAAARDAVLRALGADVDVQPFYRAFRADPMLGAAIRAFRGLRIAGSPGVFEAIVNAVLTQQVNVAFGWSIRRELTLAFGRRARFGGRVFVAFPAPERIARESETRLREFRLSGAKAGTLVRVASAFASGELSEDALRALPDEKVVERLTAIKGIGRWTADTVLMRGLGRLDAFPGGDLGVVKYLAQGLLGRKQRASEAHMRRFAERWRPFRALALVYAYAELGRRRAAG